MKKLLVPVGSASLAACAADFVLELQGLMGPLEVVLINVQAKRRMWPVRIAAARSPRSGPRDRGRMALAPAVLKFIKAGVPHSYRVEIGRADETILACAAKESCDLIVMAAPDATPWQRLLRGWTGVGRAGLLAGIIPDASVPVIAVPRDWTAPMRAEQRGERAPNGSAGRKAEPRSAVAARVLS